jgi:Na+/phosphate symporter
MVERDDDDVDLGISLETIATIVDHARALQTKDSGEAAQLSEDEDSEAALLQEHPEDLTEDALRAFINDLNEDEQAALIALAWVGRGDYDASEWEEALRLARERGEGRDTAEYLLSMDMLGDLLAEGVAAFGLSIEDVDR